MVISIPFGSFDPLKPSNIPGLFASIIFAEPVDINAPVATVWKIMTDFEHYPEWNPINRFFRLDGVCEPGERVTFGPSWGPYSQGEAQLPEPDFVTRETITVWEENSCLAYADIRRFMCAERVQYVSALSDGKSCYRTYERTSRLMSPLMRRFYAKKIHRGFTANGLALKKRAEAVASDS